VNEAGGPDATIINQAWLDKNIRRKGPLGARYPEIIYGMEGDTPSFLNLISNGLASDRNPGWGAGEGDTFSGCTLEKHDEKAEWAENYPKLTAPHVWVSQNLCKSVSICGCGFAALGVLWAVPSAFRGPSVWPALISPK
jgi:Cellulose-binding Sde182, nucleoside hydrolase-like domain